MIVQDRELKVKYLSGRTSVFRTVIPSSKMEVRRSRILQRASLIGTFFKGGTSKPSVGTSEALKFF